MRDQCAPCSGSGVVPEQRVCPACDGTGWAMCFDRHICCTDRTQHSHFLKPTQCCTREPAPLVADTQNPYLIHIREAR